MVRRRKDEAICLDEIDSLSHFVSSPSPHSRVVCNGACPCPDVKCPSDDLLKTFGERGAPDCQ